MDSAFGPAISPNYPEWKVFLDVPAGTTIEWKAVKKGPNTQTIIQNGADNVYTVPSTGVGNTQTNWS